MILTNLTLKNFRNHELKAFEFKEGINTITGKNAVGKTNVVEAIDYLSLARSFKGVSDQELIQNDKPFAAEIIANVVEGKIKRQIHVIITDKGKRILINGKPVSKISELSKIVNVVLFEPKDVLLFRASPKDRRNWLDVNLSKKSNSYLDYITRYEKLLNKRNDILKSESIDKNLLDVNTEMIVKMCGPIVNFRTMYLKDITDILNKITRALAGAQQKIEIEYKPFVQVDSNFENRAKDAFNRALESDLKHGATSIGPHREDITVRLNGKDIADYGSQGENRLVALALKLSPYFLIEEQDKKPIVILDDVMSELDKNHQNTLIKFLNKFSQVFITGTKLDINGATHYEIEKHH